MGLRNDVKEIKNEIAEIRASLAGDFSDKAKKLDEVMADLSNISIRVKGIVDTVDLEGKPALKIIYEIPSVLLVFDDNGNVMENSMFKAINGLDLISMDDKLKLLENINKKKI